jgi:hypothetical protein
MTTPYCITIRDGLGGRVAAIANGLSTGRPVSFGWKINDHCPLPHEEVFPRGIHGVEFRNPDFDSGIAPWNGRPIFAWDAADSRPTANAAYARIMEAMTGTARTGFRLGVCARFFRRPPTTPEALAAHVRNLAHSLGAIRLFILADSRREELASLLPDFEITWPTCPELTADLARAPEDTRAFISDWKTLLACPHIAAPDGPTTLLHPARAAARQIHYP